MELEDLSDTEIRQRLVALGQNVGPMTPTTRSMYIKRLRNLIDTRGNEAVNEPTPPPSVTNGDGNEKNYLEIADNETVVEDDPPLTKLRDVPSKIPRAEKAAAPTPNHRDLSSDVPFVPKSTAPNSITPTAVDDSSDGEMWGQESVRYLSPEEMELEMKYTRHSPEYNFFQPGNIRKVLIVVFLLTLVVFVFFLSDRVHRQTASTTVEDEL